MSTRGLILLGLFSTLAAAGCDGTEGWVLSEAPVSAAGEAGAPEIADAGAAGAMAEAGAGNEAGAAGAAPSERDACPSRFAEVCSPQIVFDNKDAAGSGQLFDAAVPDPSGTLTCITRDVCNILLRKNSEARNVVKVNVVIEDFDGASEVWSTTGPNIESTIHTSSRYLQQLADAGFDVQHEVLSILYYHATNIYQNDDGDGATMAWLVQGVANYVRHAGGYLSDSERKAGGKYDAGGTTTGFFLVWLDSTYPDFVYGLNQSMTADDPFVWSPKAFQDITGRPVDELWTSYQKASF